MPGGKQAAADTLSKSKTLVSFSSLLVQNELNVEVENNMANDVRIGLVELLDEHDDISESKGGSGPVEEALLGIQPHIITCLHLQEETRKDRNLVKLVEQIQRGIPDSVYDMDTEIREFHKFRQGVSGMLNRAEQAVFWPRIMMDISRMRSACRT